MYLEDGGVFEKWGMYITTRGCVSKLVGFWKQDDSLNMRTEEINRLAFILLCNYVAS